jgi:trehalose-6-phosphate synthase
VLHEALSMPAAERRTHAIEVRKRSLARTAADWFGDQVRAATGH